MKLFKMKLFTALSLLVLATVFTNCNETKKVVEMNGSNQVMGTYHITELNGVKMSKDKAISFEIADFNKSIRGTTSCNSFFGTIAKEGDRLRIIDMNISENYCDETEMETEQSLMRAFNSTASYILKESTLSLYSDSDNSVILKAVKDTI
jgi:heat shock protein HslJ